MVCPYAIKIALQDHILILQINAKNVHLHVRLVAPVHLAWLAKPAWYIFMETAFLAAILDFLSIPHQAKKFANNVALFVKLV